MLKDEEVELTESSDNFRFSAAVAGFGLLLRDSEYKGTVTYDKIIELAKGSLGEDSEGYRHEFMRLVEKCKLLGI